MGLMTNLRITLGLFVDKIPGLKNLREWWCYRRWLRGCVAITIEDLREIYRSVGYPLPEGYPVERIFIGDLAFFKNTSWRAFPLAAVDKLEQLFLLYREYQRELTATQWKGPNPRSELFRRFWREQRAGIISRRI